MLLYRQQEKRDPSPWEAVLEVGGLYGGWFYGNSLGGTLLGIPFGLLGLCTGRFLNHLRKRSQQLHVGIVRRKSEHNTTSPHVHGREATAAGSRFFSTK
jgi:hypothetical protein